MLQAKIKISVTMVDSTDLEELTNPTEEEANTHKNSWEIVKKADGIYVAGGFGIRGTEGKIKAIQYARENLVPLLGICFGFQLSVIEFCRNVLGWKGATTEEFAKDIEVTPDTKYVVKYMPEIDPKFLGGTMRKGAKEIHITYLLVK
jgi:CTP synthase